MANQSERVDVAQLAARELAASAFPAKGKQPFRVYFDRAIHERIAAHAGEKLSLEICGVLVGDWYRDDNGPYLHINEAVRANKAESNAGDVTFTHEAWNEVNHEMDTKYADRKIVGWYHTHPNFGIFLSDRDCFIQDHFFNSPGQIAYVVDPINGVEGIFCWRNGKSKLLSSFHVGDEIHLSSEAKERQPSSAAAMDTTPPPAPKPDPIPASSLVTLGLAAICLLLLGYLLGNMRTEAERRQVEIGAVAHYGLFKGLKPLMHENLDKVAHNLLVVGLEVKQLAGEHVALAGDAKEEKKKQWNEILQHLQMTAGDIQTINDVYSLTPDEAAEVQQLINEKEAATQNVNTASSGEPAKSSDSAAKPQASAAPPAKPSGGAVAAPPAGPPAPVPAPPAPASKPSGEKTSAH